MKKFFRLVSMLAVTGLAFAYTSCTDYSEDINQLEQTVIANNDAQSKALKEAQENLQKAVDAANAEIAALKSQDASIEAALAALETKHDQDIKDVLAKHASDVAAMQAAYDALKAQHNTDKAALDTKISNVETAYKAAVAALKAQHDEDIAALKTQMASDKDALQKAIAKVESDYKAAVSAEAKAREDAVKGLNAEIAALNTKLDESIKTLTERVAKDEEALKAAVSSIENLTAQHKNDVAALQGQINTNANDIDALEDLVDGIIDETIPAVKAQVDSLADDAATFKTQVAATYATKKALEAVETALGALEGRVTVVEATQEKFGKQLATLDKTVADLAATHKTQVENLQKAIAALQTAVEKAQTTADKAVADAKAAQDDATKALGNIQALKDALGQYAEAGKLAETIAALEEADDAIIDAYAAADKKTNDKVDSLYAVVDAQLKALVDADEEMAADIEKLNNEKFNSSDFAAAFKEAYEARFADDFEDAFEAALAEAVENGGVVDASIKEQVADALTAAKAYTDAVDEKVDAAIENIKELKDAVSALADRIQSIVIVPENGAFGAGEVIIADVICVEPDSNEREKPWVADSVTVSATYEVYPAKAVSKVTVENTTVKFVATGTGKGVQAAVVVKPVSVVPSNEEGRVKITAKLPSSIYTKASYKTDIPTVGSLSVAVNDKGTSTVDETVIETGTNVESEYNAVVVNEIDLRDLYVLYNGKNVLKDYSADSTFAWDLAGTGNDVFTPFEGYSWYIMDGEEDDPEYLTPAEFAKAYYLSAEALAKITPVMTANTTFVNNTYSYKADELQKFFSVCGKEIASLDAVSTSMVAEYVSKDKNRGVASVATTTVSSKVAGISLSNVVSEYTIGWRTIAMNIEDFELPWTYDVAKALSTATNPNEAYNKEISFENEALLKLYPDFKERTVTFSPSIEKYSDPTSDNYVDFASILSQDPTKSTVNGEEVGDEIRMKVDAVATLKAQVAKVAVTTGYMFKQGEKNVYEFVDTYEYNGDKTKVEVNFTLTLGAMPKDATINLGPFSTPYSASYSTLANLSYNTKAAWGTKAFASVNVAGAFKDSTQFKQSLKDYCLKDVDGESYLKDCKAMYYGADAPKGKDVKSASNFMILCGHDAFVNNAALYINVKDYFKAFTDKYTYTSVFKTWYGVNYTCNAEFSFTAPSYSLKYVPDWVNYSSDNDGLVKLDGIKDYGGATNLTVTTPFDYVVKTDYLSNYFGILGIDSKDEDSVKDAKDNLTVSYKVTTNEDATKGIMNVPESPAGDYAVEDEKGSIEECELLWGKGEKDFTGRELTITATLKYAGIELGTKNLKLTTPDPIKGITAEDYTVARKSHTDYTVNLLEQVQVSSILGDLLVMDEDGEAVINTAVEYGYEIDLEFGESCAVTVGGVSTVLPKKFSYNPEKAEIVYESDAAVQDKTVVVTVPVKIKSHKYGYMGKNKADVHETSFTVTFTPVTD